jgi:flagellar biosynthesis protein FlhF
VVRAYAGESLAGCILTKIDEAASLATALDVIMRHNLKLLYVSNGQRVPEDLHLPNRSYLLHRAFKDVPETSPHKFDGVEPAMMMANAGMVAVGGVVADFRVDQAAGLRRLLGGGQQLQVVTFVAGCEGLGAVWR